MRWRSAQLSLLRDWEIKPQPALFLCGFGPGALCFLLVKCYGILSLLLRRDTPKLLGAELWKEHDHSVSNWMLWGPSSRICSEPELQFSSRDVPSFKHWAKLDLETHLHLSCHRCCYFFKSSLENELFVKLAVSHGLRVYAQCGPPVCSRKVAAFMASSPGLWRPSKQAKEESGTGYNVCILNCFLAD